MEHPKNWPGFSQIPTKELLACGAVAGPLFMGLSIVQGVTRPGFDLSRQPISFLSLGPSGWLQITNFIVT